MTRNVTADWLAHPGTTASLREQREIGWNGLQHFLTGICEQLPFTMNASELTEWAAIGVMALLISDLEKAILQTVLPIGSGGDYFVRLRRQRQEIQVEVSGIRDSPTQTLAQARLAQKSKQVLTHSNLGFVSVTTFAQSSGPTVHSYLHCVRTAKKKTGRRTGKRGKKK